MRMRKTIILSILTLPMSGFAAIDGLGNPIATPTFDDLLFGILDAVIQIGVVILILAIIWSGYLFVTAQGNQEQIKRAKNAFTYTMIGGFILVGAWAIAEVVLNTMDAVLP